MVIAPCSVFIRWNLDISVKGASGDLFAPESQPIYRLEKDSAGQDGQM